MSAPEIKLNKNKIEKVIRSAASEATDRIGNIFRGKKHKVGVVAGISLLIFSSGIYSVRRDIVQYFYQQSQYEAEYKNRELENTWKSDSLDIIIRRHHTREQSKTSRVTEQPRYTRNNIVLEEEMNNFEYGIQTLGRGIDRLRYNIQTFIRQKIQQQYDNEKPAYNEPQKKQNYRNHKKIK